MTQQADEEVVHRAAAPIASEIDEMLVRLPASADRNEIAFDLIDRLKEISDHPEFIAIFADALIARRVLTELGIKF